MTKTLRWEMPELKKEVKVSDSMDKIEVRLNDKIVLCEDSKQFIDYLSESIVTKNNKAMMKRNIYMQTIDVLYKFGLVFIVVKYFPEIISLFIDLRGMN